MSFIDVILDKIAPHDCLVCGAEGDLVCPRCLAALPSAAGLPPVVLPDVGSVGAAVLYQGAAKQLVWKLKSSGAQSAAAVMAKCMVDLVKGFEGGVLVSVPTATTRVRQRGYDQSRLLGRCLAGMVHLPWMNCLARVGQAHQVGSDREQRLAQLRSAFRVTQERFVRGAHIILVDDVVTTGATLEAAASVLKAAGAARVDAVVFARPELRKGRTERLRS